MTLATRADLLAPAVPDTVARPDRRVEGSGTLSWRRAALLALPGWFVAHLVVGLAVLAVAVAGHPAMQTGSAPGASGLFAWDGGWYRAIALHGYGAVDPSFTRFFPLFPALGWLLAHLGISAGAALLLVANACGLGFGVVLTRLVVTEFGDVDLARRTAWLVQLVPGAGVLVLAYTEPLAGLLAAAFFLNLRRERAGAVLVLGVLSGLTRPTGAFLAVAGVCVLAGATSRRERATGAWAVLAPLAGTAAYCGWVWLRFGSFALPYTAQADKDLRGGIVASPVSGLTTNSAGGLDWRINVALVVVVVALAVVAARRLPARYVLWLLAMFAAAMTSERLHSLPRYCAALFPLLIALAGILPRRRVTVVVVTGCATASLVLTAIGLTPFYTL